VESLIKFVNQFGLSPCSTYLSIPFKATVTKILEDAALGVILSVKPLLAKDVELVVSEVESVAVTTCKTLPVAIAAGNVVTAESVLLFIFVSAIFLYSY
jgi:hypothetical protein